MEAQILQEDTAVLQLDAAEPLIEVPELDVSVPDDISALQPQSEALPAVPLQPEERVYRHDHGGGRTFEGTLAKARELCPVLARMSIQEANRVMAQSDLAERLAARGRERRAAEAAAKAAEAQKENERPKDIASLYKKPAEDIRTNLERPRAMVAPAAPVAKRDILREELLKPAATPEETPPRKVVAKSHKPAAPSTAKLSPHKLHRPELKRQEAVVPELTAPVVVQQFEAAPLLPLPAVVLPPAPKPLKEQSVSPTLSSISELVVVPEVEDAEEAREVIALDVVSDEPEPVTLPLILSAEAAPVTAEESSRATVDFEQVLASLLPLEKSAEPAIPAPILTISHQRTPEPEDIPTPYISILEGMDFVQSPEDLTQIREDADDRQPEETLIMTALLFRETAEADADNKDMQADFAGIFPVDVAVAPAIVERSEEEFSEVIRLCTELTQAVEQREEYGIDPEQKAPTPEVMELAVELLHALGYTRPERALIDLLERHDISFVVQVATAIVGLSKKHDGPELAGTVSLPLPPAQQTMFHIGSVALALAQRRIPYRLMEAIMRFARSDPSLGRLPNPGYA